MPASTLHFPSPAKRVRGVNVLGLSTRSLDERLAYRSSLYARRGLPMVLRLTSIGPDFSLDAELEPRGHTLTEETRVMCMPLAPRSGARGGSSFLTVGTVRFAAEAGTMRGLPFGQIDEHRTSLQGLAVDIRPRTPCTAAAVSKTVYSYWYPPARRARGRLSPARDTKTEGKRI